MSRNNPEASSSNGTFVNDFDKFYLGQWILLFVSFISYTLLFFYAKTFTNKVKRPMYDCKHTDGIYTVSISAEEHWNVLYVICSCFAGTCFLNFLSLQISIIMTLSIILPSQRLLFGVIVIEILACNFLLCCFCHGGFFNSTTSCKELIQNIRRQKVELLTSTDGTMQPLTSSLYYYEDLSFFENLPETDRNVGRLVHFDVKVCVKLHTSIYRNLQITSKCVLQNRMFDPNSENYMFFSKPRSERFVTLLAFLQRIRLFSCGVLNCAWKRCVTRTTLHIIKCVYLPSSLTQNTELLYIRVQDLNMYLDILHTASYRNNLDRTVIDL